MRARHFSTLASKLARELEYLEDHPDPDRKWLDQKASEIHAALLPEVEAKLADAVNKQDQLLALNKRNTFHPDFDDPEDPSRNLIGYSGEIISIRGRLTEIENELEEMRVTEAEGGLNSDDAVLFDRHAGALRREKIHCGVI